MKQVVGLDCCIVLVGECWSACVVQLVVLVVVGVELRLLPVAVHEPHVAVCRTQEQLLHIPSIVLRQSDVVHHAPLAVLAEHFQRICNLTVQHPQIARRVVLHAGCHDIVLALVGCSRLERTIVAVVALHELAVLKLVQSALGTHHHVSFFQRVEVHAQIVYVLMSELCFCRLLEVAPCRAVPYVHVARMVAVFFLTP